MSKCSAKSPPDSGCPNALTFLVWNRFYKKRIFAGSLSTLTVCSLERRAHAAPFTRPVIREQDQQPSHAIPTRAAKSGVLTKDIREIPLTGIFIATSVSIFPWNIWDRSRAEPENSPESNIIGSPDEATRNSCMTERQPKMRPPQHAIHFLEQCREQIRENRRTRFRPDHCRSVRCGIVRALVVRRTNFPGTIHSSRQQTNQISGSPRRVNIWPRIRRSKSSSPLLRHGVRTAISPFGSIRVTPGSIRNSSGSKKNERPARKYGCQVAGQPRKRSDLPGTHRRAQEPARHVTDRVLKQLARELLLAQSSDWAFLMKTGTAREYATQRTIDHLARFNRLTRSVCRKQLDEEFLRRLRMARQHFSKGELAVLCLNCGLLIAV